MAQPVETTTILNAQPFSILRCTFYYKGPICLAILTPESSRSKVKCFKQESTNKQTDRWTDATERIISPASRSIMRIVRQFISVRKLLALQLPLSLLSGFVHVFNTHVKFHHFPMCGLTLTSLQPI